MHLQTIQNLASVSNTRLKKHISKRGEPVSLPRRLHEKQRRKSQLHHPSSSLLLWEVSPLSHLFLLRTASEYLKSPLSPFAVMRTS